MPPPPASNSDLSSDATTASVLDAPADVAATGSKRTITVSWGEVAGAASYTVAVRPANGVEPLEWVEHQESSSPYIISDKLVMSGLEYEVRVAAVNVDAHSKWSHAVTVLVPTLEPAPAIAVETASVIPPRVGDTMNVALHSQRPFENRSKWHWFLCDQDGSGCKLLPVLKQSTYLYKAPEMAVGRLVKVQVDYDKGGVSYVATATLGVVVRPGGLEARVASKQINVFWNEASYVESYRIAIRPVGGTQPFLWDEYSAVALPYTVFDYWMLNGLRYELRVTAFNIHGGSWSRMITVAGPARQAAPLDAIEVLTEPPYRVGDVLHVSLAGQHPFEDRSVWHWFLCNQDGRSCKLLPLNQTDAHKLVIPVIAHQKQVQVQIDYLKDGVFYTARKAIGVVGANIDGSDSDSVATLPSIECVESSVSDEDLFSTDVRVESALYALRLDPVSIIWDEAHGGGIEPMCNDLLLVSPWGRIVIVHPDGKVNHLNGRVPMNLEEIKMHPNGHLVPTFRFRVADILLKQHSSERWELFATHHYFMGECIRFRLSSTTIIRDGTSIEVSPAWRTILDADPCLPIDHSGGAQAGGRMLTDGPGHLLIVTGDHSNSRKWEDDNGRQIGELSFAVAPQHPQSHLGKLLRVDIETGFSEVLASGLRNPQGLTRDMYGNLWSTEHGPQGGDELNLLEQGNNYGWPVVSYGIYYGGLVNVPEVEKAGLHDGFTEPVFSWTPSIAVSSIIVNNDEVFPLWRDDLLIASLYGDGNGLSLFRVRRSGTEIRYVERIELGWRIRDMTQMPDGRIALLSDDGIVYFMSRDYSYCDEWLAHNHIYKVSCESEG